jgi:hypothetical protein
MDSFLFRSACSKRCLVCVYVCVGEVIVAPEMRNAVLFFLVVTFHTESEQTTATEY